MFAVCILLSCSVVVFGQAPHSPLEMREPEGGGPSFRHGPPGPPPLIMLATQKMVQTELKLDRTQKQRIQALDAELRASMPDRMPPPCDSSDRPSPDKNSPDKNSPDKNSPDKASRPKPPDEKMEKELAEILSEKQLTRLKQIALQLEGPRALLASERVKELNLTEKQQEKIGRLSRKDSKSLHAILDEEQRAKWQEMVGRPFRGKIAFAPPQMPMPRN
jgi:Spy/CpxP family protein refolding chaperone